MLVEMDLGLFDAGTLARMLRDARTVDEQHAREVCDAIASELRRRNWHVED